MLSNAIFISKIKTIPLDKFFWSLSIEGVSFRRGRDMKNKYKTIDNFIESDHPYAIKHREELMKIVSIIEVK